jgi:hypothetical protein
MARRLASHYHGRLAYDVMIGLVGMPRPVFAQCSARRTLVGMSSALPAIRWLHG